MNKTLRPYLWLIIMVGTLVGHAAVWGQTAIEHTGADAWWSLALQPAANLTTHLDSAAPHIMVAQAQVVRHLAVGYPNEIVPTLTPTPSATTFPCPTTTPEPLWVDPVLSPTDGLSQRVNVYIGNGAAVTITTASGTFTSVAEQNQHQVNVQLLPNQSHTLTVAGKVKQMQLAPNCVLGNYTLSTTRDRNGAPLVIVQQGNAPTPTAILTPTPTATVPPDNGNECTQARAIITDGKEQTFSFETPNDVDWMRFDATAETTYRVEVTIPDGSAADVDLALHVACDGLPSVVWNETFTPGVRLDFKATATAPIYLRLNNRNSAIGGPQLRYQPSVRPLAESPNLGAVIIVAGRYRLNDPLQRNIHNVTDRVYKIFQGQDYANEAIYYLATDSALAGFDATATKANLKNAIIDWAIEHVGPGQPLTLYLMDHGAHDKFYLDGQEEIVTPAELDEWLSTFEAAVPGAKVNVIFEACFIGSFIALPGTISKPNRVVITSSDADWSAYASRDGAHFSDHFLTALQQGRNLFTSFSEAEQRVNRFFDYQNPWLDADGDGVPNQQSDFAIAAERGFAYSGTLHDDAWPPFIAQVSEPAHISNRRGLISAEVRDDKGVTDVWAVVYPPSYLPPEDQEELVTAEIHTILLTPRGGDRYAAEYPAFDEVGTYRILIHAKDQLGNLARPVELTIAVGSQVYLPLVVR